MYSSFLLIVTGLLFQVFAQDHEFHSQLWHSHLKKIYEDNEEINAYELADSIVEMTATANELLNPHQPQIFLKDQFHSQLKQTNLKKINEEKLRQDVVNAWHANFLPDYSETQKEGYVIDLDDGNEKYSLVPAGSVLVEYRDWYYLYFEQFLRQLLVITESDIFKITQPPSMTAKRNKAYLVCAEQTGVSPNTISRIRAGNWAEGDRKGKAWVQCVMMANNLMTDQGVFRLDVAFKVWEGLEKYSLEARIDKCLPNTAMPPAEITWRFAKCFQNADPKHSLF